jgi:hypothetical protein
MTDNSYGKQQLYSYLIDYYIGITQILLGPGAAMSGGSPHPGMAPGMVPLPSR